MKPKYKTKLKKRNKFEIFKTSQFEKYAKRKDVARVH